MRAFLWTFGLAQGGLVAAMGWIDPGFVVRDAGVLIGVLWLVVVLPLGGAIVGAYAADLAVARRPLRAGRLMPASVLAGAAASVGHACVLVLVVVLVEGHSLDAPMAGVSGAVCAFGAASVLPRVRQGRCAACSYDLRGAIGDVCPECGADRTAGAGELVG